MIASALSGLYSGSSIANTVTTGTFTIPLMKRTGLSPEKAGAVEVASSTNGQLTPPVMGAAAFLIAEFTGVEYTTLLKHALLPALVSYIALVYIVHLEACKLDLKGLPRHAATTTLARKAIGFLTGFIGISLLFILVYFTLGQVKAAYPGITMYTVMLIALIAYLVLIWFAAKREDLEHDDPGCADYRIAARLATRPGPGCISCCRSSSCCGASCPRRNGCRRICRPSTPVWRCRSSPSPSIR